MSSRYRQSTAATSARGTPARASVAASQRVVNDLPPYQPLEHPLNAHSRQKLAALVAPAKFEKYSNLLDEVIAALSVAAADTNEALVNKEDALKKERQRQRQAQENGDGAAASQRVTQMEGELAEMQQKVETLTNQLDRDLRKMIDVDVYMTDMSTTIKDLSTQVSSGSTQPTQRTQQNGDDEYPDFDPTDPTNVQSQTQRPIALSSTFRERLSRARDRYQTRSMVDRYSKHNDYVGFKRAIHDARYGDETTLPPAHLWFSENAAEPGQTALAADDSDDDIQIARETISTKCPLTLQEFKDPVTSRKCPHSFERDAIVGMIEDRNNVVRLGGSSARGAMNGRKAVQCPVPGCQNMLTSADLHSDPVLKRKIARIQRANRAAEESDDEGDNKPHSIASDDDDGHDIDAAPAMRFKSERMSGVTPAPSQRRRGQTTVLELDDDDD